MGGENCLTPRGPGLHPPSPPTAVCDQARRDGPGPKTPHITQRPSPRARHLEGPRRARARRTPIYTNLLGNSLTQEHVHVAVRRRGFHAAGARGFVAIWTQRGVACRTPAGFQNASMRAVARSREPPRPPQSPGFRGHWRVEPAGIEPATSCLQSRSVCPLVSRSVAQMPANAAFLISVGHGRTRNDGARQTGAPLVPPRRS